MKINVSRYAPPGWNLRPEKQVFVFGMALAALISLLLFLCSFCEEVNRLYWTSGTERALRPDAVMPDYVDVLGGALLGFAILALCMAALIPVHYGSYYRGSKSIYLMRRLPDRWELHRRCLTLPLLGIAACLLAAFVLLLVYFGIYLAATPKVCLTPGQWRKIWSVRV